ncbi:TetR/AcrR family transcriptional regulator [Lentilitoribacter sp. Alg239-R112]|uniref:TetR/AcrR family transcriptional regulator n=1 Tax=Lentilitoribacter sp. Alg239-R112 TaxID=2305987 RepID=UPI0013A6CC00|nr:TetR/AcrR family transcriptional regulator [Lentilitoribacter sp. Alg239-R112]
MKIKLTSRAAILEAAFQIFNEKPTASLGEVANYAGVGRATLHRHFSSREDLMIALANSAFDELDAAVDGATTHAQTHTEGLKLALEAIIPLANRQWFLAHEAVESDPDIAKRYAADKQELFQEIEQAKLEGTFSSDVPTNWIAETYENLIYSAWVLVKDQDATPKQAANLVWRTITTGLKP